MNVVIIGAQWGDEGKGKIVDYLAQDAGIVVRFSGGANAGHTIVLSGTTYALHLVPSGILYPDKTVLLGSGMVIEPAALFAELDDLKSKGIQWEGRVFISDRAHLVLPRYRQLDKDLDSKRKHPIGTTGRGIGVAYALKASRDGVRLADLDNEELLSNLEDEDRAYLAQWTDKLRPLSVDLASYLHQHQNSWTLFEGAQGALLDIDTGTYPFVSSGMSCAAGAAAQGGIGPRSIDRILGVFKAYTTRVGNGPFPTEFTDDTPGSLSNYIRTIGHEYGTTTGRPRRCGYLDLVALRYACMVNSIDRLVLTHLDVYDALPEFEACVGYRIGNKVVQDFPASIKDLESAVPVLKRFEGWQQPIENCQSWEDLPLKAKEYVDFIEDYTQTPISIISVGSERRKTIIRESPWIRS